MAHFNLTIADYIPCEVCGKQANDLHHIDRRGMGGSKNADRIENIMALCRKDHELYGDKKQFKEYLKEVHANYLNR